MCAHPFVFLFFLLFFLSPDRFTAFTPSLVSLHSVYALPMSLSKKPGGLGGLAPSLLEPSLSSSAMLLSFSRPASGVAASPSAFTSALPTMTPSAPQLTTCCACSPLEMPNPTATGLSVTFFNDVTSSSGQESVPSPLSCPTHPAAQSIYT